MREGTPRSFPHPWSRVPTRFSPGVGVSLAFYGRLPAITIHHIGNSARVEPMEQVFGVFPNAGAAARGHPWVAVSAGAFFGTMHDRAMRTQAGNRESRPGEVLHSTRSRGRRGSKRAAGPRASLCSSVGIETGACVPRPAPAGGIAHFWPRMSFVCKRSSTPCHASGSKIEIAFAECPAFPP